MKNLKKSKKKFNLLASKKFLNQKNYLIFIVYNKNKFVHNFVHYKLNNNFISAFYFSKKNVTYLNILVNLQNYVLIKKNMKNLLISECFSYRLIGIKFGKNFLDINFFENNFLLKQDKISFIKSLFMFIYIKFLILNIWLKKELFIILNLFFLNFNLFKYNAYVTSSSK